MTDRPASDSDIGICAIGVCTAVGLAAPAAAAAVRSGISAFSEHPFVVDRSGDRVIVAQVPGLEDTRSPAERLHRLAALAFGQIHEAVEARRGAQRPLPIFLGIPAERPGLPHDLIPDLSDRLMKTCFRGVTDQIRTTIGGHTAGLIALGRCAHAVARRDCEWGIAGGIDSYVEPETLEWLEAEERLHTSRNPWGFIPGEAAGFCLITSRGLATQHGLPFLVRILAFGAGEEEHTISSEGICTANGLIKAITSSLAGVAAPNGRIDLTICDMNGEPYRSDEYGFAVVRLREFFSDAHTFQTPADCWGDIGAASGPLFAMLCAAQHAKRYAPGPNTLIWASSDTGQRAAAVLACP
jgi:3-oxoacyl-[acyl-carrier-protein] synthase-1